MRLGVCASSFDRREYPIGNVRTNVPAKRYSGALHETGVLSLSSHWRQVLRNIGRVRSRQPQAFKPPWKILTVRRPAGGPCTTFRHILFDCRREFAAPQTICGLPRAAVLLGRAHLAVNGTVQVRSLTTPLDNPIPIRPADTGPDRAARYVRD